MQLTMREFSIKCDLVVRSGPRATPPGFSDRIFASSYFSRDCRRTNSHKPAFGIRHTLPFLKPRSSPDFRYLYTACELIFRAFDASSTQSTSSRSENMLSLNMLYLLLRIITVCNRAVITISITVMTIIAFTSSRSTMPFGEIFTFIEVQFFDFLHDS